VPPTDWYSVDCCYWTARASTPIGATHFSNRCHPPIGIPSIAAIGRLGLALQSVPPTFPIGATHRLVFRRLPIGATHRLPPTDGATHFSNWCHPPIGSPSLAAIGRLRLALQLVPPTFPIGATHRLPIGATHRLPPTDWQSNGFVLYSDSPKGSHPLLRTALLILSFLQGIFPIDVALPPLKAGGGRRNP
jgi:hypothetical protein